MAVGPAVAGIAGAVSAPRTRLRVVLALSVRPAVAGAAVRGHAARIHLFSNKTQVDSPLAVRAVGSEGVLVPTLQVGP